MEIKVIYDDNNIVTRVYSGGMCLCGRSETGLCTDLHEDPTEPLYCEFISGLNFVEITISEPITLYDNYNLPQYMYDPINNCIDKITDINIYLSNPKLNEIYRTKITDEILEKIKSITDDAILKEYYESLPDFAKAIFFFEFELFYSYQLPQNNYNLTVEVYIKLMNEVEYYERVLELPVPEDIMTAYKDMVTRFHNHASLVIPNINLGQTWENMWFKSYQETILTSADQLRSECLPRRYYITGMF